MINWFENFSIFLIKLPHLNLKQKMSIEDLVLMVDFEKATENVRREVEDDRKHVTKSITKCIKVYPHQDSAQIPRTS